MSTPILNKFYDQPERIVRDAEVERLTGLKRGIRFQMEARGQFPKRRRITERLTGYVFSEIAEWIEETVKNAPTVEYPEQVEG